MDEPSEVGLVKQVGAHFDVSGGRKQVTTEVFEVGETMGAIFMNPVVPPQNASDISRPNADFSLQGVVSSSNLPVMDLSLSKMAEHSSSS